MGYKMSDTTQLNKPLWHQNLTYGQVEAEAEKDYPKVIYNLHEDCLCLREELAALKADRGLLVTALLSIVDSNSFDPDDGRYMSNIAELALKKAATNGV
jgi:hypothetical protein